VKTKTTDSGRVVPVAVRSDLTEEALKGKSIKDKPGANRGGRAPKPAKAGAEKKAEAPRSWMGKIGNSLRMKLLGRKVEEEDAEIDEWTEGQLDEETKGFARSGSQKGKGKRKSTPLVMLKNLFVEVVKLILLVLLLRAYVLQVSEVNGPSMEPTLLGGAETQADGTKDPSDRLVVERVTAHLANLDARWTDWLPEAIHPRFHRGDIIVVRSPENPGSELVKRLIALPGDVIKFDKGKLFIKYEGKGEFQEVDESYLDPKLVSGDSKTKKAYEPGSLPDVLEEGRELTVPDQRIMVMGDNRPHSNDSRKWLEIEVGKAEAKYGGADQNLSGHNRLWLHISSIEGRVLFRIFPLNRIGRP
jgi:signal peptidase I